MKWACPKCDVVVNLASALGMSKCYVCGYVGAWKPMRSILDNRVILGRKETRRQTREDEGWTSTLAKLMGPEPEESAAAKHWWCGCRCHRPGGIAGPGDSCLGCAHMHNPKGCEYEQHHGPGAVCNECGYIGNIVP